MRRLHLAALALAGAMFLAGCTSGDQRDDDTRAVSTDFGVVELPVDPQAALGMYMTDIDMLIELGVPLAKSQPIRTGQSELPAYFPQDAVKDLTFFGNYPEYSYEKIAAARPDLILNSLAYDASTPDTLAKIAPTLSFNGFGAKPWRDNFALVAEKLDRTDRYDAWTARYEKRLAEVKAKLGSRLDGVVVAPVWYMNGQINTGCLSHQTCSTFADLGVTVLDIARENGGKGVVLSMENIARLSDVTVALAIEPSPGSSGGLTPVADEPAWNRLPFVQQDSIFEFPEELTYGSPSGQMELLDRIEEWFLKR